MRVRMLGLVIVTILVLGVAFTGAAPAVPNGKAIPAANALPKAAAADPAEPHPEIREAIGSLRRAKEHMEHAAHDFGGHRVEAIRATDEAIHQLEVCLRYDKD
jgi:hypothetical protein